MLRQRLNDDIKTALKAGDRVKISTLRLVSAALQSAEIDAKPPRTAPLGDAEVVAVLTRMVKQRRDSAEQFGKGGRQDLVDRELAEITIIESYLPTQLDDTEMSAAVAKIVAEVGATGPKDMGKVMGALKSAYAGRMDFGTASALVKDLLKERGPT